MKNRIYSKISYALAIFMCITLLPKWVMAVDQTDANTPPEIPTTGDVWDGTVIQPSKLVQKDGIYYYEITKCSELAYVAQTGGDWLTYNYILEDNLIINDVVISWDENGIIKNNELLVEWTVMDNFTGIFNGNNYNISGIYIDSSEYYVGLFSSLNQNGCVMNLKIVNSYVKGRNIVGGLVGRTQSTANITNCSYSGIVVGKECGGIVGSAGDCTISDTIALGTVIGTDRAGGICGGSNSTDITNCVAKNEIFGGIYGAGGLIGSATNNRVKVYDSYSTGNVYGIDNVGGFIGFGFNCTIEQCFAIGNVTATEGTAGGFIGKYEEYSSKILDCYAIGNVSATVYAGGFAGSCADDIFNCYCLGNVSCENVVGGFIGEDRRIWGEDFTLENCYFLRDENINTDLDGIGNVANININEIDSKTILQMKNRDDYLYWDFENIWKVNENKNGGYPYLTWQEDILKNLAVKGTSLNKTSVFLSVGDYEYLIYTITPINASNQKVNWQTDAPDIVTVTSSGKITALSAGTAVITVTTEDGGHTASCTVTVTERTTEEYRINSITLRDNAGALLTSIPTGTCLATVSITNMASAGDTMVILASYTADGQYQGMMWVSIEALPVNATIQVTLPIDNSNGEITSLKAFTTASFSNLVPLGNMLAFPE